MVFQIFVGAVFCIAVAAGVFSWKLENGHFQEDTEEMDAKETDEQ